MLYIVAKSGRLRTEEKFACKFVRKNVKVFKEVNERTLGSDPCAHNIILIMDSLKFSHFLLYERKTFLGNSLTAVSKIAVFSRQSELFEWELFIQFWEGKT